jgi:hypothetical protein
MPDAYVIEVAGRTVGLVVRTEDPKHTYRFLASLPSLFHLDGQKFAAAHEAERAARLGLAGGVSAGRMPSRKAA